MSKTRDDFQASVAILKANLKLFGAGHRDVYRVIAVELRKLMCEWPKPLLLRVFRDVPLHQVHLAGLLEEAPSLAEGLHNYIPGILSTDSEGRAIFDLCFHKSRKRVPLMEWIEQPCFNRKITFRELIKSVADKEGAHADPEYNDTLRHSKEWLLCNDESHVMAVCGIAKYLLAVLEREKLEELES